METPTKAGQAYYAFNQAVNNFAWIRTNIFETEQKRREVILKSVEAVKGTAESFLQAYSEEYKNGHQCS